MVDGVQGPRPSDPFRVQPQDPPEAAPLQQEQPTQPSPEQTQQQALERLEDVARRAQIAGAAPGAARAEPPLPAAPAAALSPEQAARATALRDRFRELSRSENHGNRDEVNAARQRTLQEATREAQAITDPAQRDTFIRHFALEAGDAAGRASLRNRTVVGDAERLANLAGRDTARAFTAAAVQTGGSHEWSALATRGGVVSETANEIRRGANARLLQALAPVGEVVAGLTPVVGQGMSLADFSAALQRGDGIGMGLAALGVIPGGRLLGRAGREVHTAVNTIDDARTAATRVAARASRPYEGKLLGENMEILRNSRGFEDLAQRVQGNNGRLINGVIMDTPQGRMRVRIDFERTARDGGTPRGLHYNVENLDTGARQSINVTQGTLEQQQAIWLRELRLLNGGR